MLYQRSVEVFKVEYKLVKPFNVYRKPKEYDNSLKFVFSDLYDNQPVVQTILESEDDFVSINFKTLKDHYNYGYKFQQKINNEWTDLNKYKKILPTQNLNENGLSYSFIKEKNSSNLLIIFSSSPEKNVFNYSRILNNIKINKLFISDKNLKEEKYSSLFYLGHKENTFMENEVIGLIESCINELKIDRENVILTGSSKGGFASLYYGFKYGFKKIIVGSPTIYLGTMHKNSDFGINTISNLTSEFSDESIKWLDNLIISNVLKSVHKPKIYYHVGNKENRYFNHALPFLKKITDLKKATYELDLGNYKDHSEVSKFYPKYLLSSINQLNS